MGRLCAKRLLKNSFLLSKYSLDMTNTVFPTFQTPYILDFSSVSFSGKLGFAAKH
jgi:hypothetical protein